MIVSKKIRMDNFEVLHQRLKGVNRLSLTIPEGPYMYPLYIKDGDKVRRKLQDKMIYIPVLWSDVFNICSVYDLEYDMALNILPLPVDQRYDINDMEYLAKQIILLMK